MDGMNSKTGLLKSLWTLFGVAWRFRPLKVAFWVGLLVGGTTLLLPNEYTSEGIILPTDAGAGGFGGLSLAAAAIGINLPGAQNSPDQTLQTILESRWLGDQLLTATYEFKIRPSRFSRPVLQKCTLLEYLNKPNVDLGFRALSKVFNVERNLKTGVLTIETVTRSPELSQQVTALAVRLLESFLTRQKQGMGGEKVRFTSDRIKEAMSDVLQSESRLKAFLESNRNYQQSSDPDVKILGGRLEADLALRRQVFNTLTLNREQSSLDQKDDTPILNVLERGTMPIEKSRPHRALLTGVAMVLAFLWTWGIERRAWLLAFLREEAA